MNGPVEPQLKDLIDCSCGRDECTAFGVALKSTGHPAGCLLGCEVCDSGRRKVKAAKSIPPATRRQLKARSRGQCEARVSPDCTGRGVHAHHRSTTGGHTRDDRLSNLLHVCHACHNHIHLNVADAYLAGHLERTTA